MYFLAAVCIHLSCSMKFHTLGFDISRDSEQNGLALIRICSLVHILLNRPLKFLVGNLYPLKPNNAVPNIGIGKLS